MRFFVGVFLCVIGLAWADRLAYVDVNKIFATAKPSLDLQSALKAKFKPEEDVMRKDNDRLVAQQNQMRSIIAKAPTFDKLANSDQETLDKLSRSAQKTQSELQQKYMTLQQKAQRLQNYAIGLILEKVNSAVRDLSTKQNYDMVFTNNQIIYAKHEYDITDAVIVQVNTLNSAQLIKKINEFAKTLDDKKSDLQSVSQQWQH
jgi:Skp family chaperone for outer membrane proteins